MDCILYIVLGIADLSGVFETAHGTDSTGSQIPVGRCSQETSEARCPAAKRRPSKHRMHYTGLQSGIAKMVVDVRNSLEDVF